MLDENTFPPAPKPKGALRSKAVWGAIMTLVGAFGILPFGITFDAESGLVSFNIYSILGAVGTAAIPGGAVLGWIGRKLAKNPIKGLF